MGDTDGENKRLPGRQDAVPTASLSDGSAVPGGRIDKYKILSILGEGGYGVVYLAEQQKPVKRRVALKVIKPGMDTKQVIARFEAERQALALLDHPNVAHVFDAGTTDAGRPYFVMEYVKGVPLTEHCDRQTLTIEERLRLFIKVCEAIQHAHQKGIVHRDIKPSNVQVAIQGEQAVPKIIDFGVAKAISQSLTEQTLVTEQGQFVGTPEYMSPEQAEMTGQDIDTRTDIYSLGVVLYELLTGTLPFDPKTLRGGGADHIRHVIRDEYPKTPSTRLNAISGEASTKVAQLRRTDVRTLGRKLHGDLDWITIKAMEKDRMRRYQTAHALAEDIQRHLSHEPVLAGPPSALYRFQKLVHRNKGIFAGVAAVAASLVLGLTISAVSLVREQQSRRIAVAAQENEATLRRQVQAQAYASDMSLAQQALAMNDLGRARRLLEDHRPRPDELDLRGWEWRYLWQECRGDAVGELCRHPNSTYSVAYSPDGKILAVAGFIQEFIEIWDVSSHKRITTLQSKEGHLVAFSPRGDLLATDAGNQIRLWKSGSWDLVAQLTLSGEVRNLKFSSDGRWLASLDFPDELTVWEVDQRTIVRQVHGVRLGGAHKGSLDFSPDCKALVTGDADGHLQGIDLGSGTANFRLPEAHSEGITSVAWSPNGSIIASGSGYLGGPIQLWDAASGKALGALEGHTSWICELIFSSDGSRLYSASADQTIRVWDVRQRQPLATLRGSSDEIYGLALSPDGTALTSACKDGTVAFWNASPLPGEEQPRLIALGQSVWPTFAPSGRVLAVPQEGIVSLFDLATSKEIEQLPALGPDRIYGITYSPDGTLLAGGCENGKIRVWSCTERRLLRELGEPNVPIYLGGFRSDGRRLFSGNPTENGVKVIWWDTLTWQAVRSFTVELTGDGAFSPDGRLFAGATMGAMCWLNAETGELLATASSSHRHTVVGVAFSDDGSRAASVAEDGTVAIWDTSSFQPVAAFKGHMLGAHGVAFSPDGRRLATGGSGREAVKLWDLSTYRELLTLPGQGSSFRFVAFSPDGTWLAACGSESKVHLWRAPSWAEIEAAENKLGNVTR